MDFVYVDEVQDLTMKQLTLLKYICKNVKEGFVFAGDTAQTIAKGVDFRFEDITCLFYNEFLLGEENKKHKHLQFQLNQNFRTHAGVLNLAQSITEIIHYFFPQSIDKLKPETSPLRGEAPVLLDCGCHDDAISMIFHNKGNDSEDLISFGSEQVILVRDDRMKDEIIKCIGRRAIVLTIFECKGLEFQDVLLYNFFGSSPLEDQWRIIYEYMEQHESLPKFSHAKHNILCYELKQLYVAVTRTRQRLWICEDSGGFSSPMVRYWQELNIVQGKKLDDSYAREMAVINSLEAWKLQGLKMLEVRNYKTAAQCFRRAEAKEWETYAQASELKEAAQNMRSLRLDESLKMLQQAAVLFGSISNKKKAAECYFDAEDYEKAASIYYAESDIQRAGECFTLAGCFKKAAEIYAEAFLFNECLHACSEGKLFELGLQYIRRWQQDFYDLIQEAGMDINAIEQTFLQKCAYASYKQEDKESMMRYVKDFSSLKLMRSFLKKWGCLDEHLELLVDYEKYIDAAKIARQMGKIVLEADLLDKGHHYHEASSLYLASVLAGSLWADYGGGWPLKEFHSKEMLSSKAEASAGKYMPDFHRMVSANIQLLSLENQGFHYLKRQLHLSRKNCNLMGGILAARKILGLLLESGSHFEVRGRKNKVDVTILFEVWNFWIDNIVKILSFLRSFKGKEPTEFIEHGNFCLEYLGVRKRSSNLEEGYFMLYPDATWVRTVPRRSDKKDSLTVWQLVNAGERYWCSELLSVGMKLLDTLESIQKLGARNFMHVVWKRHVHVQMFEVAASLLTQCRFLKQTRFEWHSLMSYIDLSSEDYFLSVFSVDKMALLSEESIAHIVVLRNILNQAILKRYTYLVVYREAIEMKKPTIAQLVKVVVVLLGSVRHISEHHKEILNNFGIGVPWRPLLNDLIKGVAQVCHLRDALIDVYSSKSHGYHSIPPSCFVYLLDRLVIMVSCFRGRIFSTRSSVIEWLIHMNWEIKPETFVLGFDDTSLVTSTSDFLAYTVHGLLVNRKDMEEWFNKTGFDPKNNLRVLTLKLVIILSLICLNFGTYLDLLSDVFLKPDVIACLPTKFLEVVFEKSGSSFQNVIAEAIRRTDDTLVVIKNPKLAPENIHIKKTVFLNVFNMNKDKMLEKLCYGFTRQP